MLCFFLILAMICPFKILLINLQDFIPMAVDPFTLVLGFFSFLWEQKDNSESGTLTLDVFSRHVLILYLVCARLKCVSDDVPIWYDPTRAECVCYTVLILLGSRYCSFNYFYRVLHKKPRSTCELFLQTSMVRAKSKQPLTSAMSRQVVGIYCNWNEYDH